MPIVKNMLKPPLLSMKISYKFLIVILIFFSIQIVAVKAFSGQHANSFTRDNVNLGPLYGRNQAPLLNLFYLMPITDGGTVGMGKYNFRLDFDISNIYERHSTGNSILLYDMEIYRTAFQMTYGVYKDIDIHVEIPMLAFNGGKLDGPIEDYHEFFGFPNGGRENSPDGIYDYSYKVNGQTLFDFPSHGLKLSDSNVDLKWRLNKETDSQPSLAVRFGIKIPTGHYDDGTGSGEFDYSFGLALSKSHEKLHVFSGIDYTFIREPAALSTLIDEDIIHFFLGVEYELIDDALSFICQLDGQNTPFIETGQRALDNEVLEIVVGAKGANPEKDSLWQLSLREDLIHYSTVDFTLTFSMTISVVSTVK